MEDLEALPVGRPPPGARRRRRPRERLLVAASGAVLVAGLVAALARGDPRPPPSGSGFVWACDLGSTTAVVRFDGLPAGEVVEVHVNLRGDVAMLPVTGEEARLTTGRRRGHQQFLPVDGELAVLVPLLAQPPHRARLVRPDTGAVILDFPLPVLAC